MVHSLWCPRELLEQPLLRWYLQLGWTSQWWLLQPTQGLCSVQLHIGMVLVHQHACGEYINIANPASMFLLF